MTVSANGTEALGGNNRGLFAKGKTGGNRGKAQTANACKTKPRLREPTRGGNQELRSCGDPKGWLVSHAEGHTAQNTSGNKHPCINTGTS